jgi:hypothetical protein
MTFGSLFHSNLTRITRTLDEDLCTFMTESRWILLRVRNVSDKSCSKIITHIFLFYNLFLPKIVTLWDNTDKYGWTWQATSRHNMAHALCLLYNWGYRHTFRICNTAVPPQQWLLERASMLRYTYNICLVNILRYDVRYLRSVIFVENKATAALWLLVDGTHKHHHHISARCVWVFWSASELATVTSIETHVLVTTDVLVRFTVVYHLSRVCYMAENRRITMKEGYEFQDFFFFLGSWFHASFTIGMNVQLDVTYIGLFDLNPSYQLKFSQWHVKTDIPGLSYWTPHHTILHLVSNIHTIATS